MNISDLALFQMIGRNMDYQSQRQTVIAENIANADTPGYQPRDLQSFADVLRDSGMNGLQPVMTHSRHVSTSPSGGMDSARFDDVYETAPSGNEVILEQQLIALNEVSAGHQLGLRLMDRHLGMMRMALGRGS